jgi:membrane-associated phospholipid phosphatase
MVSRWGCYVACNAATLRLPAARVVSAVLAPAPVASALLILVASKTSTSAVEALASAALTIAAAILAPTAYVEHGIRRGRFQRYLPHREDRPLPLAIAIGSIALAILITRLFGGREELMESLLAMLFVLTIALGVTLVWKISMHTAALAGAVVVVGDVFGGASLLLIPLLGLVVWSRVALGQHTPAQVAGGILVGIMGSLPAHALVA